MNTKSTAGTLDSEYLEYLEYLEHLEHLAKVLQAQAAQFNRAFQLGRDLAEKDTEKRKAPSVENALHHVEIKDLI